LHNDRRRVLADPDVELYLTREWYAHEGRVTLADEDPGDVFPSPYRLDVPVTVGLRSRAVKQMMRVAFGEDLGIANFFPPSGADVSESVRITFTAAANRAARYVSDDISYLEAVDAVWGVTWQSNTGLGLFDLRTEPVEGQIKRADPKEVELLHERIEKVRGRLQRTRDELDELKEATFGSSVRRRARSAARAAKRKIVPPS
jgi:hypothetical protein